MEIGKSTFPVQVYTYTYQRCTPSNVVLTCNIQFEFYLKQRLEHRWKAILHSIM